MHRHPAACVGHAGAFCDQARLLRRNDVEHIGPVLLAKGRLDLAPACIHAHNLAIVHLPHPFDHVAVQRLPALHEQCLLGERRLGIEQEDLGLRLVLPEIVRHHGRTLIRAGRAAERILRNRHDEGATILHGLQLALEQLRLRTGLPGVWRMLGGSLVIALQLVPLHVHPGGQHQLVPAQGTAVGQLHRPAPGIKLFRARVHHLDALLAQAIKAMAQTVPLAQSCQVEIGERTGIKALRRLDQGDLHIGMVAAQIARCRCPAKASSDHHHVGRCLACLHQRGSAQQQAAGRHAAQNLTAGDAVVMRSHRGTFEKYPASSLSSSSL